MSSAEEHRVAGLITATIEGGDIPIDHDLRARLTASAIASAAEHDSTLAAATSVLAIAADLGIDVAVFKGLAIAYRFYTDPTLRPATDVDVFVAPHHTDRLPTLARALGVEDTSEIEALTSNGSVFEVMAVVDGVAVDIHSDPMNMIVPSKDPEERWSRTISVATPSGFEFRTLDLEDSIIQSLLNSFRDNFADLLHINDLRLMIAAGSRLGRGRAPCGRRRMDGPHPVCHVVRQRGPWVSDLRCRRRSPGGARKRSSACGPPTSCYTVTTATPQASGGNQPSALSWRAGRPIRRLPMSDGCFRRGR